MRRAGRRATGWTGSSEVVASCSRCRSTPGSSGGDRPSPSLSGSTTTLHGSFTPGRGAQTITAEYAPFTSPTTCVVAEEYRQTAPPAPSPDTTEPDTDAPASKLTFAVSGTGSPHG